MGEEPVKQLGRYQVRCELARGGMAAVHYAVAKGAHGFSRPVAIKRMLPELAHDGEARKMILDEARLASHVHHPNVVQIIDVVDNGEEVFLVMEYVHGPALHKLIGAANREARPIPYEIASAVISGVLRGLEAAHRALDENGKPLEIIHRDISPSNILLDTAGQPRVLDFGVARAQGRLRHTTDGRVFGKMGYLAPEQVHGEVSVRSDLFSAAVVLWEMLAARRLFWAENDAKALADTLMCKVPKLSEIRPDVSPQLQQVLDRALAREPQERFESAQQFCDALVAAQAPAGADQVAAWVQDLGAAFLVQRQQLLDKNAPGDTLLEDDDATRTDPPTQTLAPKALALRMVAAGTGTLVVTLLLALGLRWALARSEGPPPPEPIPHPVAQPAVAPPSKVVEPKPEPEPEPKPAVTVAPPAEPEPAPSEPNGARSNPRSTPKTRPAPKRPPAAAKVNCDPPYFLDAAGYKRFKPECF